MGLPTQQSCDPEVPEEHCLWPLVNIGGLIGAPLLVPEPIMREWSKHLYSCGFRHHPELQEIWYQAPEGAGSVWEGAGGTWSTTRPEDLKDESIDAVLDGMDESTRRSLRRRLEERGD